MKKRMISYFICTALLAAGPGQAVLAGVVENGEEQQGQAHLPETTVQETAGDQSAAAKDETDPAQSESGEDDGNETEEGGEKSLDIAEDPDLQSGDAQDFEETSDSEETEQTDIEKTDSQETEQTDAEEIPEILTEEIPEDIPEEISGEDSGEIFEEKPQKEEDCTEPEKDGEVTSEDLPHTEEEESRAPEKDLVSENEETEITEIPEGDSDPEEEQSPETVDQPQAEEEQKFLGEDSEAADADDSESAAASMEPLLITRDTTAQETTYSHKSADAAVLSEKPLPIRPYFTYSLSANSAVSPDISEISSEKPEESEAGDDRPEESATHTSTEYSYFPSISKNFSITDQDESVSEDNRAQSEQNETEEELTEENPHQAEPKTESELSEDEAEQNAAPEEETPAVYEDETPAVRDIITDTEAFDAVPSWENAAEPEEDHADSWNAEEEEKAQEEKSDSLPPLIIQNLRSFSANRTAVVPSVSVAKEEEGKSLLNIALQTPEGRSVPLECIQEDAGDYIRYQIPEITRDGQYALKVERVDAQGNSVSEKMVFSVNQQGTKFIYNEEKSDITAGERYDPEVYLENVDEIAVVSCTVNGQEARYEMDGAILRIPEEELAEGNNEIAISVRDAAGNLSAMEPWKIFRSSAEEIQEQQKADSGRVFRRTGALYPEALRRILRTT